MSIDTRFLSATLAILLLSGCGKSPEQATVPSGSEATPLAASSVVTLERQSVSPGFTIPAVIEASQMAKPRAQVTATLLANNFTGGEMVKKGTLLVELDDSQYQSAVQVAEANLESAKASLVEAETDWQRAQELKGTEYISERDFDDTRAKFATATANVSKAEANLVKANLDLTYTKIYAPFDGKISRPGHAVGDLVGPSATTSDYLFELVELDPIYAISSVELSQYNKFVLEKQEFEQQGKELPEFKVTLNLAGNVPYPHEGKFEAWSHSSEATRGMIAARILVPNPDALLLPGQIVSVKGGTRFPLDLLMVPQKAVFQDQQGYFVRYINNENRVQRANVEMGIRDGENWAIRSGLDAGSRVIVTGGQRLREGTLVAVQN